MSRTDTKNKSKPEMTLHRESISQILEGTRQREETKSKKRDGMSALLLDCGRLPRLLPVANVGLRSSLWLEFPLEPFIWGTLRHQWMACSHQNIEFIQKHLVCQV